MAREFIEEPKYYSRYRKWLEKGSDSMNTPHHAVLQTLRIGSEEVRNHEQSRPSVGDVFPDRRSGKRHEGGLHAK
jgi:hypothetical protein